MKYNMNSTKSNLANKNKKSIFKNNNLSQLFKLSKLSKPPARRRWEARRVGRI